MTPQKPRQPRGLREVQAPFEAPDTLSGLHASYDFMCAFTGESLEREAAIDPRGALLVLGDDPLTGDPALLIPACLDAIHAFERGHIALGLNFNLLIDLERINPELLARLNPTGKLRLPRTPAPLPSLVVLAAHRLAFMEGNISRA